MKKLRFSGVRLPATSQATIPVRNIYVGGGFIPITNVGRDNMKKLITSAASASAAMLLAANIVMAHTPSQPPHQLFNEGDLKLESGEVIKDFSISYVTHGTLNAKKSN